MKEYLLYDPVYRRLKRVRIVVTFSWESIKQERANWKLLEDVIFYILISGVVR